MTPAEAATASAEIAALSGTPNRKRQARQLHQTLPATEWGHAGGNRQTSRSRQKPIMRHRTRTRPIPTAHPSHPPKPAATSSRRARFDAARLPKKARHLDYPVAKILCQSLAPIATRSSFRAECTASLARSADHQSGPRKYDGHRVHARRARTQEALHMVSQGSTDMEFEPRLAAQLDHHWENGGQGRDSHALD